MFQFLLSHICIKTQLLIFNSSQMSALEISIIFIATNLYVLILDMLLPSKIYENTILSSFTYIYSSTNLEVYCKNMFDCHVLFQKRINDRCFFIKRGRHCVFNIDFEQPDVGIQSINYETLSYLFKIINKCF